jgi:phage terminase small subunit
MAELVNLRMARKRANRRDDAARASPNRLSYGPPKHLRDLAKAQQTRASRDLDGRRLEREDGDGR